MAKKVSENKITSLTQDWGKDESNGLPYSGQAVQDFIKEGISTANTAFAERAGAQYFDPTNYTLYSFKNEEDRDLWLAGGSDTLIITRTPFSFSGTQNQVKVVNGMPGTNLYFTTNNTEAVITTSFLSQQKGITDAVWEEVLEDFLVTVSVDKGSTGAFTAIVTDQLVLNGQSFSVDVRKYIGSGSNRVRVTAKGSLTGTTGNLIYSVTLTSMYLSPSNFAWHKPFVEGETYTLGGMNIGGNIQKTLKVKVTNPSLGYEQLYEENIGTATYTTNAYFFKGLTFPNTGTGTYNFEIWLDANGLESDHLSYDIMCVAAADKATAQLACINEVSSSAANGGDMEIMKYSVYSTGAASASPTITLSKDGKNFIEEVLTDVTTAAKLSYSVALELESEETSFDIVATVTLGTSSDSAVIPVDNTASFPSVSDASFYMNAATRNNNQPTKEAIINEADGSEISATWTNMAWVDGMDGWTTDESGRKCLRLPATCHANIAYQPMSYVGEGKTVEIAYKVSNAADYDENIITIATNPTESNFQGIRIKPKKITVHTRDLKDNDEAQSYPAKDEEFVHLLITFAKNYKTNYGNICTIYVNGGKKCSFEFTSTDNLTAAANILLGSDTADLFIYKMRVYESGFGWQDAAQNFTNSLATQADKIAAWNKITTAMDDSFNVDYDAVYGKYNTMVIEMKDGASLPDSLHSTGGQCDLWINILDPLDGELDSDFAQFFSGIKLEDQTIEGQGTTAMTYYRWNFRWKLSELYNKRRITAKKNVASSMHSHKMGATRLFHNLHDAVVGANEASARVAVYQYPVYGFTRTLVEGTTDQYTYTFCGLYTIGPDKGDKTTFGYDNASFKTSVMHLEGTDHTPTGVGMEYPWDQTRYDFSREAMGGILSATNISAAWEVGAAGEYKPDKEADQANVQAMLDAEYKPAYEIAYNNSTFIEGVTESLTEINANISAWRARTNASGKAYTELEFWTDGVYDLYYYNVESKTYQSNGVNLLTQLGLNSSDVSSLSLEEKNNLFKTRRRENFKANMGTYWHVDDSIFHYTFCMMFAATDNFKKNSYPYKFASLNDGGKWRWRQDDLDTLFDINNQGFSAKMFSVLVGDVTSSGSGAVYRGENSVFWTLISECFVDEIKTMVHRIFDAIYDLSTGGDNRLERIVNYIRTLFWNKAQNYFGEGSYNADAEWTYEEAWYLGAQQVNALQQSLGSHYEAERDWVELRIVFLASYFNYGPFNTDNGDDKSTGQISFRAIGDRTYTITPAIDFNPTLLKGQESYIAAGGRILAGESADISITGMGENDTHVYIQGTDYYSSVGDLKDLTLSADDPNLQVASKRLRSLKVGDETAENVTSNVRTLTMGACPSMEEIDARNLVSLTGSVDLSKCPRLKKALFGGTSVASIMIPEGSKMTNLSLPGTLTTLSLVKTLNLTEENLSFDNLSNLEYVRLENNSKLSGFEMLKNAYANSDSLRNIRVVGFDAEGDSTTVEMIAAFATATDENGNRIYYGIDENGNATVGIPVLDGYLNINGPVYEDTLAIVNQYYPNLEFVATTYYVRFADPEVNRIVAENWGDGTGTTLEQIEAVTDIGTKFSNNSAITSFEEFEKFTRVTEIPYQGFAACTSLKNISLKNIKKLQYQAMTGCTSLYIEDLQMPNLEMMSTEVFVGASIKSISNLGKLTVLPANMAENWGKKDILERVVLPRTLSAIPDRAFYQYITLKQVEIPDSITTIGAAAFIKCDLSETTIPVSVTSISGEAFSNTSLSGELYLPNLTFIGGDAWRTFDNCKLNKILSLGKVDIIANGCFIDNKDLTYVELPESVSKINSYAFSGCSSLLTFLCNATTPPNLSNSNALTNTNNCPIYVPDASVEAYKTATNWSAYADRIMSKFYYLGYIDFVDPAVRDICVANFDTDADGAVSMEEAAAVTDIGTIFQGNTEITSFDEFKYFTGVTKIIQGEFQNCSNLVTLTLPDSITEIQASNYRGAFMGTRIEKIKLPLNLTTLPLYNAALSNMEYLKNVILQGSVNISNFDFQNTSIETFSVENSNTYKAVDSVVYTLDGNELVAVPPQKNILPNLEGITTIRKWAFYSNAYNGIVELPSSISNIGEYAFSGAKLSKLIIRGNASFYTGMCFNCPNLKVIDSYSSAQIGYAYNVISNSVESIILRSETLVKLSQDNSFNDTVTFYVPDSLVDVYKTDSMWSINYADQIKSLSEYPAEIKIAHVDGSLYTTDEWTSGGYSNEEADGVAVIGGYCSFIIAKENAASSDLAWGGNKIIENIATSPYIADLYTDYNGYNNTNEIIAQLSGYTDSNGVTGSPAAEACAAYTFTSGKKGYLPAYGEYQFAYTQKSVIDNAMSIIGGVAIPGEMLSNSSQRNADSMYAFNWGNGVNYQMPKSTTLKVRAFTML